MVRHLYLNRNIACMIVISLIANMSGSMILPLFAIYVEQFGISVLGMSILFSLFYVGDFLVEAWQDEFMKRLAQNAWG